MTFLVDIPLYSGPLDLLLHIVRREEISLSQLPLATIASQFLEYLDVLVELQIDDVAEFVEIASLLVEMKSRQAIPTSNEEEEGSQEGVGDLSDELVYRLMEYKRIRDAASILEEQGAHWQLRYSRLSSNLPVRRTEVGDQPIQPIEVWDLVSAFGRILRERQPPAQTKMVYDETPIHLYMEQIHGRVHAEGRVELTSLFEPGMHKSALVAMFLATLELTRHHGLATEQKDSGHPLYLLAAEGFEPTLAIRTPEGSPQETSQDDVPNVPR